MKLRKLRPKWSLTAVLACIVAWQILGIMDTQAQVHTSPANSPGSSVSQDPVNQESNPQDGRAPNQFRLIVVDKELKSHYIPDDQSEELERSLSRLFSEQFGNRSPTTSGLALIGKCDDQSHVQNSDDIPEVRQGDSKIGRVTWHLCTVAQGAEAIVVNTTLESAGLESLLTNPRSIEVQMKQAIEPAGSSSDESLPLAQVKRVLVVGIRRTAFQMFNRLEPVSIPSLTPLPPAAEYLSGNATGPARETQPIIQILVLMLLLLVGYLAMEVYRLSRQVGDLAAKFGGPRPDGPSECRGPRMPSGTMTDSPPSSPWTESDVLPQRPAPNVIEIDSDAMNVIKARVEQRLREFGDNGPERHRVISEWKKLGSKGLVDCFMFGQHVKGGIGRIDSDPPSSKDVWFVGDVHGDLLGLETILYHIETRSGPGSRIVFLGDLIDDGFHMAETVLAVVDRIMKSRGTTYWIAGNHDVGLGYTDGVFKSTVLPAEFVEYLNLHADDRVVQDLGRLMVELVNALPRALFLPYGLLAAHGGFPHTDLQDQIHGMEDLVSDDALRDFVWNRQSAHRRKIPDRGSTSSEFGADDFLAFCKVMKDQCNVLVLQMIRGHDHINNATRERYSRLMEVPGGSSYEGRILTINTMSYQTRREHAFGVDDRTRCPVAARWRPKESIFPVPVVFRLPVQLVDWYAPLCPTCQGVNAYGSQSCSVEREPGRVCGAQLGG